MKAKPEVDGLDIDRELALLFSFDGELLWWASAWHPPGSAPCNPAESKGRRWEEFVHPEDLEPFRAWLLVAPEWEVFCYRFYNLAIQANMRMWIGKSCYGQGWLCIGHPVAIEAAVFEEHDVSGHLAHGGEGGGAPA